MEAGSRSERNVVNGRFFFFTCQANASGALEAELHFAINFK